MKHLLLALGLALLPLSATAAPVGTTPDTRPAAPQQRKQWQTQGISAQFSGTYLSGNVNLITASGTLSYNLNLDQHQFFVDFGQLYTLAGSNLIANRLNGSLLYAYNLLENFNL
ncbi:MAG: hypothetical protein CVV27_21805, partial [Candidatus Melainabacteria bacterium HGW-Melainabacteria-1]